MIQATLWVMIKYNQIFLWEKKRWFAKWVLNWVWWKLEWKESIENCMIREAKEEIGIDIVEKNLDKLAVLHFYFEEIPDWNMDVHIFNIKYFSWDIIETEEIKPFWYNLNEIPYDKMWKDDIYWLPRVLNWEKDIEYNFYFDNDNWSLIKYDLLS